MLCILGRIWGGIRKSSTFIETSKNLIDALNSTHWNSSENERQFASITNSISFYDSVIVFERGHNQKFTIEKYGNSGKK